MDPPSLPRSPKQHARRCTADSASRTNLERLVSLGDAYDDLDKEPGMRALWTLALPHDAATWLRDQPGLDKAAEAFADVWYHYVRSLLGDAARAFAKSENLSDGRLATLREKKSSAALEAMFLAELAAYNMAHSGKMRGRFQALLFQAVVTDRHDQTSSYILGDPSKPFSHYVSRSKIGALFSLRGLLAAEKDYAPAARSVALFRRCSGKNPVALQRAKDNVQMCKPIRKRLFLYRCERCAKRKKRGKPNCKECSRIKEGDPSELVRVWGSEQAHEPKKDTWTVVGDVEAVAASQLSAGDVIVRHTVTGREDWRVVVAEQGVCAEKLRVSATRRGERRALEYDKSDRVLRLLATKLNNTSVMDMLKVHPDMLHEATVSVHVDQHMRRRPASSSRNDTWRYKPVRVRASRKGTLAKGSAKSVAVDERQMKRYLIWRCAVAMVVAAEPYLETLLADAKCCRLVTTREVVVV